MFDVQIWQMWGLQEFERSGDHAEILFSLKRLIPTDRFFFFFFCSMKINERKIQHILFFFAKTFDLISSEQQCIYNYGN